MHVPTHTHTHTRFRNAHVPRARLLESLNSIPIHSVYAAKFSSAAVTRYGEVYTWGHGKNGRLGHGNDATLPVPQQISFYELVDLDLDVGVDVDAGAGAKVEAEVGKDADVSRRDISSTGNTNGMADTPRTKSNPICTATSISAKLARQTVPMLLPMRPQVICVSMAENHCLAVGKAGQIWAWGSVKHGKLGLGNQMHPTISAATTATTSAAASTTTLRGPVGAIHVSSVSPFNTHGLAYVSVPTQIHVLRRHHIVGCAAGKVHWYK